MKYAEVAVNSPIARRRSFSYSIPSWLTVNVGQGVWVPFGPRTLQGIVTGLTDFPSVDKTRDVIDVISPLPLLSSCHVELAQWISDYYLSPLFDAIALMLPPGFERKIITYFKRAQSPPDISQLTTEQEQVFDYFTDKNKVSITELQRKFGKSRTETVISQLVRKNVLVKIEQMEDIRIRRKYENYINLKLDHDIARQKVDHLHQSGAYQQAAVIKMLADRSMSVAWTELKQHVACQWSTIKSLEKNEAVSIESIEVKRDPLAHLKIFSETVPSLTSSQTDAWRIIERGINDNTSDKSNVILLQGVTGSGKTEIYLRALAETIIKGRKGICLVPEISLTPQTIERFAARFPGRVAVLHSRLSLGQQFDEWNRIMNGECDVVVGPRSALFAPQPDLGLIIIDEEHEWTYKQTEKPPRYHTRETAIKLARLCGAIVILGSATPDVETFYRAQQHEFTLVELKERITPRGISPLPDVEVVNLLDELKAGNRSVFSRSLLSAMSDTIARREQIILFLNRRGAASFLQCRDCGLVPTCRRCMAALTFHSTTQKLICHHCHYSSMLPDVCPECGSKRIKYLGIGTQKVEEETRRYFPSTRILRLDMDAVTRQGDYEKVLTMFRDHEADVLVGTQMIAKGLDMPLVTLSAVIAADIGLNLPDFRASERTFQLSCQIAGRAGRGFTQGRVIFQTYCPDHYAIRLASRHDYHGFYRQEVEYRRQFGYPPFNHLARLVYSHTNEIACQREAERMWHLLGSEKGRQGIPYLRIIGPAPAFVPRIRGRYQWQMALCGQELPPFLAGITFPQGWTVDIDPVSVL